MGRVRMGAAFRAAAMFAGLAACGPVRVPEAPSGELIAFGGGPGGARDACFTCHGLRGEGDGATPLLAGLSVGYMHKQLEDYATLRRRHPDMAPIAARLAEGDRRAAAAYYASLPGLRAPSASAPPRIFVHGAPERGIVACADCHGEDGRGRGTGNPAIAGQPAAYTALQLANFKRGVRRNDAREVMGAATRRLSDDEVAQIATYLAAL